MDAVRLLAPSWCSKLEPKNVAFIITLLLLLSANPVISFEIKPNFSIFGSRSKETSSNDFSKLGTLAALTHPNLKNNNNQANNGGLGFLETIALIQALNNGKSSDRNTKLAEELGELYKEQRNSRSSSRQNGLIRTLVDRQLTNFGSNSEDGPSYRQLLPVPPVPPIQPPFPRPPPGPTIILVAIAAFIAAVIVGAPPPVAVVVAFFAVVFAFLTIIVQTQAVKDKGLIKKIVIKKTVLPFIIPIPIKKKEKEIIYKEKPVPVYIKSQDHNNHHSHHEYKKMDSREMAGIGGHFDTDKLDQIEDVVNEQDKLQSILDGLLNNDGQRKF